MRYISPLRYPGGKARLAPYIAQLIARQRPRPKAYAEAFAGGAGAALRLLVDNKVDHIYINDLDPGISALWRCIFEHTEQFAAAIETEEVSIDAWHRHSEIYRNPAGKSDIELGFSTFFLNRCNRSGILRARPIGGLDQTGKWKIDARFNRENLIGRIRHLGTYSSRVTLSEMDARHFISSLEPQSDDVLLYVDPLIWYKGIDFTWTPLQTPTIRNWPPCCVRRHFDGYLLTTRTSGSQKSYTRAFVVSNLLFYTRLRYSALVSNMPFLDTGSSSLK